MSANDVNKQGSSLSKVRKTFICFDTDGNVIINYYSPFGEREERILNPEDAGKYYQYLCENGLQKVLDKYELVLPVKLPIR